MVTLSENHCSLIGNNEITGVQPNMNMKVAFNDMTYLQDYASKLFHEGPVLKADM